MRGAPASKSFARLTTSDFCTQPERNCGRYGCVADRQRYRLPHVRDCVAGQRRPPRLVQDAQRRTGLVWPAGIGPHLMAHDFGANGCG